MAGVFFVLILLAAVVGAFVAVPVSRVSLEQTGSGWALLVVPGVILGAIWLAFELVALF